MNRTAPLLLGLLFAATSCGGPGESPQALDLGADAVDGGRDVGGRADDLRNSGAVDTAGDLADSPDDLAATWHRFELLDGSAVEGEWIATYDTSVWWTPQEGKLYGVFDPSKFAAYPNDRSIEFVRSADVASIGEIAAATTLTFRQFLRDRDIHIARPPFAETSYAITGNESYHLEEDGYGNFAWDFEITDDEGNRFQGTGLQNEDYHVWGAEVLSGASGTVIEVIADGPDNAPGSHPPRDEAINNMVGIAVGGSYYVYYLHFSQGGVGGDVEVGSLIRAGDRLGYVGNSGVSLEPHLHVVLLWYDAEAGRSYSVPVEFHTVGVATNPIGPFQRAEYHVPQSGEWLRDAP